MSGGLVDPKKMVSAKDFPKVTPEEQAARDKVRRRILKEEQSANLQAGEPDEALDAEVLMANNPRVKRVAKRNP